MVVPLGYKSKGKESASMNVHTLVHYYMNRAAGLTKLAAMTENHQSNSIVFDALTNCKNEPNHFVLFDLFSKPNSKPYTSIQSER